MPFDFIARTIYALGREKRSLGLRPDGAVPSWGREQAACRWSSGSGASPAALVLGVGRRRFVVPALLCFPATPMATETFQASRWTRGNGLFPTVIEVSEKAVTRRKRSLVPRR